MPKNVNSITLCGRLGADAEVKQWDDGCTIEWSMAVNDSKKQGDEWVDEADWLNCRMNRKSDKVAQYLKKGMQVTVTGRMKAKKYEKDGEKRVFYFVKVQEMDLPQKEKGSVVDSVKQVFGAEPTDDLPF